MNFNLVLLYRAILTIAAIGVGIVVGLLAADGASWVIDHVTVRQAVTSGVGFAVCYLVIKILGELSDRIERIIFAEGGK